MAKPRPKEPQARELALAIEVFVRGFGFTRSFTHPYLGEQAGPLWVLRDGPRKESADYRAEEWITLGTPPAEVDRIARARTRGRFAICAILPASEDDTALRAAYKALGYRFNASEAFMVHDLKKIPRLTSPAVIRRVLTPELAELVAKAAGSRQVLPEHLHDNAQVRLYAAERDGRVAGWVRSIVCPAGTWCSNMFVLPAQRRQGIASALLAMMLRDDRSERADRAVLLASHAGAKLYPRLGYRDIGRLLLFRPKP